MHFLINGVPHSFQNVPTKPSLIVEDRNQALRRNKLYPPAKYPVTVGNPRTGHSQRYKFGVPIFPSWLGEMMCPRCQSFSQTYVCMPRTCLSAHQKHMIMFPHWTRSHAFDGSLADDVLEKVIYPLSWMEYSCGTLIWVTRKELCGSWKKAVEQPHNPFFNPQP